MNVAEAEYLSSTRDRLAALAKSERYSDEARATLRGVAGRLDMLLASEPIDAPAPDHEQHQLELKAHAVRKLTELGFPRSLGNKKPLGNWM